MLDDPDLRVALLALRANSAATICLSGWNDWRPGLPAKPKALDATRLGLDGA